MKKQCMIRKALSLCLIAGMLVTSISTMGVSAKNKPALSCKKMVLRVGEKKKLSMKKTNKKVIWSSRNKKIATVNKKGIVCGKHVGTTKIVARIQKKKIHLCGESDEEGKAANDDSSHGDRCTSGKYAAGTGYDQSGSRNRAA